MKARLLIVALLIPTILSAQKTKTVSGSYTYYAPTSESLDQAKQTALDRAKLEIIAENFGTTVNRSDFSMVENSGDKSKVKTTSIGESQVKGEWIETKGKPEYEFIPDEHFLVVKVTVTGVIREIVAQKTEYVAKLLRNGDSQRNESDTFKDGDDLFLYFKSPESGFLTVYLSGPEGVFRLLPYKYGQNESQAVEADKEYVFFKMETASNRLASEYVLCCDSSAEVNRVYVIFSPVGLTKAVDSEDEGELMPAYLPEDAFQKWLSKRLLSDPRLSVQKKDIVIKK